MYRILSSKRNDIDILSTPYWENTKFFHHRDKSASVIYKTFAIAGKYPFVIGIYFKPFSGRENTFASLSNQILEA